MLSALMRKLLRWSYWTCPSVLAGSDAVYWDIGSTQLSMLSGRPKRLFTLRASVVIEHVESNDDVHTIYTRSAPLHIHCERPLNYIVSQLARQALKSYTHLRRYRVFIRYITLKVQVLDLSSDLPLFDRQYRFLLVYVAIASLFCTVSEKLPLLRSYNISDCMWPWKVLRFNNTVGITGHIRSPMHV